MTKPAFIRYLPARLNARLRPLGRPAVWIPLTVTALLGAILWEYRQNPDWFNRQPITNLNPDSSLTAEEEARLSEIDNLDVLLKGARVSEDTDVVTSQINPDAPIVLDDEVAVSSADAIAKSVSEDYPIPGSPSLTPDSDGRSGSTSAFANVTGLPGRSSASLSQPNSQAAAQTNAATSSLGTSNTTFNFGNGLVNPAAPGTNSALAEAVNRRSAQLAAEQADAETAASDEVSAAGGNRAGSGAGRSLATPVVPSSPVPGPFMRTTPEMSPPAGTTGYRVPNTSSLPAYNVTPERPTRNPFDASSGNGGRPSVVPAPVTVAPPAIGTSGNLSGGANGTANPGTVNPGALYTAPSSVQPEQDPVINPRF